MYIHFAIFILIRLRGEILTVFRILLFSEAKAHLERRQKEDFESAVSRKKNMTRQTFTENLSPRFNRRRWKCFDVGECCVHHLLSFTDFDKTSFISTLVSTIMNKLSTYGYVIGSSSSISWACITTLWIDLNIHLCETLSTVIASCQKNKTQVEKRKHVHIEK